MSARDERLRALFDAVADLPSGERAEYLERQAADDASLRGELDELLERHDAGDGPVDRPLLTARDRDRVLSDLGAPPDVPGYRVVRLIGEGSASKVWAAVELGEGSSVAIKVLRTSLAGESMLRRFELEIELLGRLSHPSVARILGAGRLDVASGGQPYLIMEQVDGSPLQEHVKNHPFPRDEALAFLAEVADAIQHAHARGIIHRDLKPANVLVDRSGRPRIIDFGVARLLPDEFDASTRQTRTGQLVGTLAYMSPEQAAGRPEDVDARSDVYAIGLIGYELLTSRRARDVSLLPLGEALRRIAEEQPTRLGRVRPDLGGDVETVLARALETDPSARYPTASELAADLRRVLAGEPIVARPTTMWERSRVYARRHRAVVAAASVIVVLLIAAVVGTSFGLVRARGEASRAKAVTQFLSDVFLAVDPTVTGHEPKMRDLLTLASERVEERLGFDAALEEQVRDLLGEAFDHLGDAPAARRELSRVFELRRARLGPDDLDTLRVQAFLGVSCWRMSDLDAARRHLEEVSDRSRSALGPDHPILILTLGELSEVERLSGNIVGAAALLEEALALSERVAGADHPDSNECRLRLADVFEELGRLEEAEALLSKVTKSRHRRYGAEHPRTLRAEQLLAKVLMRLDRIDEAEPLLERGLESSRHLHGPDHPSIDSLERSLAYLRTRQGRLAEAVVLSRRVVETRVRRHGEDDPRTLSARIDLARGLALADELEEAERVAAQIVETGPSIVGPQHPILVGPLQLRAYLNRQRGEYEEALAWLERADDILVAALGEEHPERFAIYSERANVYRATGDERAEAAFLEAERLGRLQYGEGHREIVSVRLARAALYVDQERRGEAIGLLESVLESAPDGPHAAAAAERLRVLREAVGPLRAVR